MNSVGIHPDAAPRGVSGEQGSAKARPDTEPASLCAAIDELPAAIALSSALECPSLIPASSVQCPPVTAELLAAVPPPVAPTLAELQEALDSRRLLIIRLAAGVSWTALVAVGTAVLLHVVLFVGLYVGSTWVFKNLAVGTHDVWAADAHSGGSGARGGIADDDEGSGSGSAGGGGKPIAIAAPLAPPPPSAVATPPMPAPPSSELALLRNDDLEVIGVPSAPALASGPKPRVGVRVPTSQPAPATAGIVLAAPLTTPSANPPAAATAKIARGNANQVGHGNGAGDDDGEGDGGPVIDIMKAGSGSGRGHGNGVDRGPSGADTRIKIINSPVPNFPENLSAKMIGKKVAFAVTVLPDDSIGEIKLIQSSGTAEIDSICRTTVARWRFKAAIKGGKPIADQQEVIFD